MEQHRKNLMKVCRFCGVYSKDSQSMIRYVNTRHKNVKRWNHVKLYNSIFITTTIHPVPLHKIFCFSCCQKLVQLVIMNPKYKDT